MPDINDIELYKQILKNYAFLTGNKVKAIRNQTGQQIVTAIIAAFSFVIALSWRDAIKKAITAVVVALGISANGIFHELVIALLVTVICVIGITLFSQFKIDE